MRRSRKKQPPRWLNITICFVFVFAVVALLMGPLTPIEWVAFLSSTSYVAFLFSPNVFGRITRWRRKSQSRQKQKGARPAFPQKFEGQNLIENALIILLIAICMVVVLVLLVDVGVIAG